MAVAHASFAWIGYVAGGLGAVGVIAAGTVVVRSSSTEKLLQLRREIEDAQTQQLGLRDLQIEQLKRDNDECKQSNAALQEKYTVLQEQVSGSDAIIHSTQVLMGRHTEQAEQHAAIQEQNREMIAILKQIRGKVGTRRGAAG